MEQAPSKIKPWHIAAALAVFGIGGAISVAFLAGSIDDQDKRQIVAWEAYILPRIADVRRIDASLREVAQRASAGQSAELLRSELSGIRISLQQARRPLQEQRYDGIVIPATSAYLTSMGETLAALAVLENALASGSFGVPERATFDEDIRQATEAYQEGERLRLRLKERAGLE